MERFPANRYSQTRGTNTFTVSVTDQGGLSSCATMYIVVTADSARNLTATGRADAELIKKDHAVPVANDDQFVESELEGRRRSHQAAPMC